MLAKPPPRFHGIDSSSAGFNGASDERRYYRAPRNRLNMTVAEELHGHDEKMGSHPLGAPLAAGVEGGKPTTTLREDVAAVGLDKVYERHGRIDLVPLVRIHPSILPRKRLWLTFSLSALQPSDDPHGVFLPKVRATPRSGTLMISCAERSVQLVFLEKACPAGPARLPQHARTVLRRCRHPVIRDVR